MAGGSRWRPPWRRRVIAEADATAAADGEVAYPAPHPPTTPRAFGGRILLLLAFAAAVAALSWWAFDTGAFAGGTSRRDLSARNEALGAQLAQATAEASGLRTRASELESELAMTRGTQEALSRQVADLSGENAQLKEDLAFLQRLVAEADEPGSITIPRLTVERESEDAWHYAVLVVRGGPPTSDYHGKVVLQATIAPAKASRAGVTAVTLPEDQPASGPELTLSFKYYQRVEGTLHVPAGSRVTAVTARVYEDGNATPRASRTLTNP